MRTHEYTIVVIQSFFIFPAALFMAALVVRTLQWLPYDAAITAQQIVGWYAERMWTLWVLLLALPAAALATGGATLLLSWKPDAQVPQAESAPAARNRTPLATLLIAAPTASSAGILAVVVLHMLAN